MQGLIEKLSQSKGKVLLGLGGAALVGLVSYLYQEYKKQNIESEYQQPLTQSIEEFKLEKQLDKFKAKLNLKNPTLEQVKAMLSFSSEMTFKEIQRIHNDFKKSRRLLKSQGHLKDYFKTVGVGLIRIKQIAGTLQQAIMEDIGLTPDMIVPHQQQLARFMHEQQTERAMGNKQITLGDVRKAIQTQVVFMKEHGDQLVSTIIENCKDWQIQAKKFIPDVFTIYLTDQIALKHPQMDGYDMRGAEKRFEKYLVAETNEMKYEMVPKISRLIQELDIYAGQQPFEQGQVVEMDNQ